MEHAQTRPLADLPKRRYVVSLPTICMVFVSAVTLATALFNGMSAPAAADHAPPSTGALRPHCFKTVAEPGAQRNPVVDNALAFKYVQCMVAHSPHCLEELPQLVEQPCGPELARVDAPRSRNWLTMGFSVTCVLVMCVVTRAISLPLRHFTMLLTKLQEDPSRVGSLTSLNMGMPSWISEVYVLQKALERAMHRMDILGHFLPPRVVQSITFGDDRNSRPHVVHRDVAIMFLDVQDFTKLCQTLPFHDMLSVMTRCVSVMTHASESYEGTVAELQGDGLLVFWNTPASVENYVAKACRAALASQYALTLLYPQFAELGLPKLAMRIGLHAGPVLSGFLGGKSRMKFGCMGDSVNLTSRLEGLCKYFGVGVICSEAIYKSLPPDSDFLFRKLDKVQVKGRREATVVYELMHVDKDAEMGAQFSVLQERAGLYEQALDAYQAGHFMQARKLAVQVLKVDPEDPAAQRLLERIASCVDEYGNVCLDRSEQENWTGVLSMNEK